MNNFLTQEDVEQATADQLLVIMLEIKDLENDLARWASQEQRLNRYKLASQFLPSSLSVSSSIRSFLMFSCREISSLGMEREARAHEAARALSSLRDITEDLKMKELVIFDYTKQSHETETR